MQTGIHRKLEIWLPDYCNIEIQSISIIHTVTFYKVAVNTELVNPEPLLLGEHRAGFLPACGPNI